MDNEDGYFDEQTAARYDESSADMFEPGAVDPVVEVLAKLAGGGRALELGIGTGRIALPLARRGVPVHGIELSRAMAARLRAKPGSEAIGVTIGDFATTKVDGTFSVAYLVFNTIMNLTTQEAQVACFRNVAAQLEPGGCFVIEVRVPELRRLPAGQNVLPWHMGPDHWVLYSYDVATQAMRGHYVEFVDGRGEYSTIPFRYVWPAELDLMRSSPACGCATGGANGRAKPSPATAASTSRSGRSPPAQPQRLDRDAPRPTERSRAEGHVRSGSGSSATSSYALWCGILDIGIAVELVFSCSHATTATPPPPGT